VAVKARSSGVRRLMFRSGGLCALNRPGPPLAVRAVFLCSGNVTELGRRQVLPPRTRNMWKTLLIRFFAVDGFAKRAQPFPYER
jgi:hypothetical protein